MKLAVGDPKVRNKLTNSIDEKMVLRQTLERQTIEPTNPRIQQTLDKNY